MWTQRDQLQAYQYLRRRLVSAIQRGDANHPASPSRRVVVSYGLGATAALLIVAGFGIYGLVRPGANQNWRAPGQVVIEKESGAEFVLAADGLMHPMLNYASARLLAGGDGTATTVVSARSLAGAPRGAPLGIAGAPNSLPAKDRLLTGAWTVCSQTAADGPAQSPATSVAMLGPPPASPPVPADRALIVSGPAGQRYAVIAGRLLHIRDQDTAAALGFDQVTPVPVPDSWVSAVTRGPELALVDVAGAGGQGPTVDGKSTQVGEVLVVRSEGSTDRYYLVQGPSTVVAVSQTKAALVLGGESPVQVSARAIGKVAQAQQPSDGYPLIKPQPLPAPGSGDAVCAVRTGPQQSEVRISKGVPLPPGAKAIPARVQSDSAQVADKVFVPPGQGALVRDQQSPGDTTGTVYLLTDTGVRYPVGGGDAQKALGYGGVTATPVDYTVLALFPTGPVLDIVSAGRQVAR
ncbi:MAG: type VII secretion protein EccB [Micromonosporaceae bacterium]|nr:type VII secretion protein EccB [Micromonosporaceae bacterium]